MTVVLKPTWCVLFSPVFSDTNSPFGQVFEKKLNIDLGNCVSRNQKKKVYMCIVCFGRYIWIRSSEKLSFILTHEKTLTWCADYGSVTISTNSLLNKGMSTQLPNLYSSISYRKYFHNIYLLYLDFYLYSSISYRKYFHNIYR